jgi:hypothetical protein
MKMEVYRLSASANLQYDLILDYVLLTDDEIVKRFDVGLTARRAPAAGAVRGGR